jgi:outer membrane protein assembly factor BamE (lipoprotein component of BamABCDE complex)
LLKVIKSIQATFSHEEWDYLKKLHKRKGHGANSSQKSSNMSIDFSSKKSHGGDEDIRSDSNSHMSHDRGSRRQRTTSFAQADTIQEAHEIDELEEYQAKDPEDLKNIHREKGHLDLKDVT